MQVKKDCCDFYFLPFYQTYLDVSRCNPKRDVGKESEDLGPL